MWFRYQQQACTPAPSQGVGRELEGQAGVAPSCRVLGKPLYYDTFWWSNSLDGKTNHTGPSTGPASPSGFYSTLLESKRWWAAELEDEGVMKLSLPSPGS